MGGRGREAGSQGAREAEREEGAKARGNERARERGERGERERRKGREREQTVTLVALLHAGARRRHGAGARVQFSPSLNSLPVAVFGTLVLFIRVTGHYRTLRAQDLKVTNTIFSDESAIKDTMTSSVAATRRRGISAAARCLISFHCHISAHTPPPHHYSLAGAERQSGARPFLHNLLLLSFVAQVQQQACVAANVDLLLSALLLAVPVGLEMNEDTHGLSLCRLRCCRGSSSISWRSCGWMAVN